MTNLPVPVKDISGQIKTVHFISLDLVAGTQRFANEREKIRTEREESKLARGALGPEKQRDRKFQNLRQDLEEPDYTL